MESTEIALSKLAVWEGNVRKTAAETGLDELAASIAAHGLLQPLVVMAAKKGKYHVVAGQRRLMALASLAKSGRIESDMPVACMVTTDNAAASEMSLAENVVRVQMHPADQFEAFRQLADAGSTADAIAARFGVTEAVVLKRLKLARVAPALLAEYRAGKLSLEQIMAFTVSDDHARQVQVWKDDGGRSWNLQPHHIRQLLTEGEIPATDKRVCFVTLDGYEAAGGIVRRDLFDDQNAGWLTDAELLDRLVSEKLEAVAALIRAEGWKWVIARPASFSWDETRRYRRAPCSQAPLTEEQEAEKSALAEEYDDLVEVAEGDTDNLTDEQQERLDAIQARLDEMDDRPEQFEDNAKAIAGVLIALDYQGEVQIERGWIAPEDQEQAPKAADATPAAKEQPEEQKGMSATLIEDLTQQRTVALQAALASQPHVALAAVVHAFALQTFYGHDREKSCLAVSMSSPYLPSTEGSTGAASLKAAREQWQPYLPKASADLWDWCAAQEDDRLAEILAVCVAGAVNTVQRKAERPAAANWDNGQQIARALAFDIGAWWTPTAENFFGRIGKPDILAAVVEASGKSPAGAAQMKKAELAALAEREIAGTVWQPAIMRTQAAAE